MWNLSIVIQTTNDIPGTKQQIIIVYPATNIEFQLARVKDMLSAVTNSDIEVSKIALERTVR